MAEIITSKKSSPRVDLTPMVDLGFLLITFFIISTTMQEQRVLKFFLPADGPPVLAGESTTLTLVPTANNVVSYFHGSLEEALTTKQYGVTGFSLSGGVGELLRKKKQDLRNLGKDKDMTIIIYPDKSSSYKNLVDLVDEMLINDIHKYCITDNEEAITGLNNAIKFSGQ
ncbi:ExbD/TolR family protein [Flavihumibacter fluvii]|uniref:ExbD/TolR family protein n=1 Tax=Flavihumibacter fluvii TaxID=2838157 RepID=UPI001BDE15D9|nr:biopolymer transporter ExbD [Flavihumibacter fluvii]ULQ51829.1 biopolymer transporter ExbD [Flavihumibacter fluvii]